MFFNVIIFYILFFIHLNFYLIHFISENIFGKYCERSEHEPLGSAWDIVDLYGNMSK